LRIRKSGARIRVRQGMRWILIIGCGAVLVWLSILVWPLLGGTRLL
jgi:hypothetical protein